MTAGIEDNSGIHLSWWVIGLPTGALAVCSNTEVLLFTHIVNVPPSLLGGSTLKPAIIFLTQGCVVMTPTFKTFEMR